MNKEDQQRDMQFKNKIRWIVNFNDDGSILQSSTKYYNNFWDSTIESRMNRYDKRMDLWCRSNFGGNFS